MIAILVATAVVAQPTVLPHLRRGEIYARARNALLRSGWRPVETFGRLADGTLLKEFGDAGEMRKAGFKEVFDCTGTGLNYCTFIWKRANRCVHVITRGEYAPDVGATPGVYTVKRGSCSGEP